MEIWNIVLSVHLVTIHVKRRVSVIKSLEKHVYINPMTVGQVVKVHGILRQYIAEGVGLTLPSPMILAKEVLLEDMVISATVQVEASKD